MINRSASLAAALIIGVATLSTPAHANDALLDLLEVLRDKGTLTDAEYRALRNAAIEEPAAKQAATTAKAQMARGPRPAWIDTLTLDGDLRLRYQRTSEDDEVDRGRGRLRYRLGIVAQPNQRLEVGAGLASGSSDPRSTNLTFDETFSSKGINLDYAYAQYRVNDRLKAIAGKFRIGDYLYSPTDLMWDTDINPEGTSLHLASPNAWGSAFANAGVWVLAEESGSTDDPYLLVGQIGQGFDAGNVFATVAGTWYSFQEIDALSDYSSAGSNTDFRFDSVYSLGGEVGLKDTLGTGVETRLMGEWVHNDDTITSEDTGYSIGVKASRGAWSLEYLYADLEVNAWPDILPDSDRFEGLTGVDGHEFVVGYDVMENVSLGLDYYDVDNEAGVSQDVLQLDLLVEF